MFHKQFADRSINPFTTTASPVVTNNSATRPEQQTNATFAAEPPPPYPGTHHSFVAPLVDIYWSSNRSENSVDYSDHDNTNYQHQFNSYRESLLCTSAIPTTTTPPAPATTTTTPSHPCTTAIKTTTATHLQQLYRNNFSRTTATTTATTATTSYLCSVTINITLFKHLDSHYPRDDVVTRATIALEFDDGRVV